MRYDKRQILLILSVLAAFVLAPAVLAGNVDLATVPPRDSVQLTIYNSEDLTLVREARSLTLKKGLNKIQYSWVGTLIDPTSVEIRPLEKADQLDVLDTTFPHDRPQHLIWNIESKIEGLFEGVFGRAFKTNVQPIELALMRTITAKNPAAASVSHIGKAIERQI